MIAPLAWFVPMLLSAAQDSVLDRPVWEDTTHGIVLPRPFDDWVFAPAASRGTTTVIFQPRTGSLSDQLWGVLVVTTLERTVPLRELAGRRIETSWRPQLGASFTLIGRDSLDLVGLPAIRLRMAGSLSRAVLEIEEYLVLRGNDLLVLQFRYPRGLPRDSIARGYARTLSGFAVRGANARATAAAGDTSSWRALAGSPWRVEAIDATIEAGAPGGRRRASVRLDLVHDGGVPAESLVLWLPAGARLDSAELGRSRVTVQGAGRRRSVSLASPAQPGATVRLVAHYTWSGNAAAWLPVTQPTVDSAGDPASVGTPSVALRFSLPVTLRAVATGRLVADVVAGGRRVQVWASDNVGTPTFVLGEVEPVTYRGTRPAVWLWRGPRGSLADSAAAARLAERAAAAWATAARAFGPLAPAELHLVESDAPLTRGWQGLVVLGRDAADPGVLAGEIARSWWGGAFRVQGPGASTFCESVAAWFATRVDSGSTDAVRRAAAPLDSLAAAITAPRMREWLGALASDARGSWLSMADVLAAAGPDGAPILARLLR